MSKKFEFTYSAPTENERREIEEIRKQYQSIKSQTNPKFIRLQKLDRKVKDIPTMISLILGFIGFAMFGLGFAMILEWNIMVWGIILSIIGCLPLGAAYFAYLKISNHLKNKYSDEILKLSEELLEEGK